MSKDNKQNIIELFRTLISNLEIPTTNVVDFYFTAYPEETGNSISLQLSYKTPMPPIDLTPFDFNA